MDDSRDPLERLPATVRATADLSNSDDCGPEESLFRCDFKNPLSDPFGLTVAVGYCRVRGRWPFRDKVKRVRNCRGILAHQITSTTVLGRLTGHSSDGADKNEAGRGREPGTERKVDQVANACNVWFERRKAKVEIHSPA